MIERILKSPRLYWLFRIGWLEHAFFVAFRWLAFRFSRHPSYVLKIDLFGFDFSKWQGAIDFLKVFLYGTKFLILRCAYGLTRDERFVGYMLSVLDYFAGRLSVYHYYVPTVDPIQQANKIVSILEPYRKYIKRVWGDFEFPNGGAFEKPTHWQKYAETIVAAGYKFGVYTRATWWDSRVGTLASWFAQFPVWAAQYAPTLTLIPRGWTKASLWQTGTPAIGGEVGTESKEVDHNIADDEFYAKEYGGVIAPPPTGEPMKKYKVVWSAGVARRSAPTTTGSSTGLPAYSVNQVVDVLQDNIQDQTYPTDPNKKWVQFADGFYGASIYGAGSVRMVDVTEPPSQGLPDLPVTIMLGDDVKYIKQTVNVVLKPK